MADVVNELSGWQEVFDLCRVPESHTGALRENITRRLCEFGRDV